MIEDDTTVCIDVRVRVLDLAEFLEDWRNDGVDLSSEVDKSIVLNVTLSKCLKMHVAGVGVSQDSMAVTWNDLTLGEGVVSEFLDLGFSDVVAEFFLYSKVRC